MNITKISCFGGYGSREPPDSEELRLAPDIANVNQLPETLLVEILDYVRENLDPSQQSSWMAVLRVCRHWHDLACSTPWLWRIIHVYVRPEWLIHCLAHAAGTWTYIHFHASWRDSESNTFPHAKLSHLLSPYRDTIRALSFDWVPRASWGPSLFSLFSNSEDMASLTRLELHFEFHSSRKKDFILPPLRFPTLHSLHLSNLTVPQSHDVAVYQKLRQLTLHSCIWASTIAELLEIFAAMPALEVMDLQCVFTRLPSDLHMSAGPSVVLPRLHTLSLEEYSIPCYFGEILTHLHFPAITKASLYSQSSLRSGDQWGIIPLILPPIPSTTFPFLANATTVVCTHSDYTGFKLSARDAHHGRTMQFSGSPACYFYWDIGHFVADAMTLCPDAPVTSISIGGIPDTHQDGSWERLFRSFPLLQTLELTLPTHSIGIWKDLRDALQSTGSPDGIEADSLCAPNLLSLYITDEQSQDYDAAIEFFEVLQDVVQDRVDHGARLEELILELEPPRSRGLEGMRDGYEELCRRYVGEMEKLVGKICVRTRRPR